jgi:hypothetical protein
MKSNNSFDLPGLSPERPIKNRRMRRLMWYPLPLKSLCSSFAFGVICLSGQTLPSVSASPETAPSAGGQTTDLTNDSVLKLAKAGMGDEVILNVVISQPGRYTLSPDALISLKQAGVSDQIIAAMVSHTAAAPNSAAPHAEPMMLHDGTPVRLRLGRNLSSADATTGETVDFEVLDDVKVGEQVVIARGAEAIGTITDAEHKKRIARGGKLDLTLDSVRLVDDEKVALRGVKETKGGGHTGAMTGAMVATAIVVWPAAPLFLFMHGTDTTILKGTEITAYTDGEVKLDSKKISAKQL